MFVTQTLQEMTLTGEHVRSIGDVGVIYGIAANTDLLAVGTGSGQIHLLDFTTGALIRSFGAEGTAEGQLQGIRGLRFTPDGGHILVAEYSNKRLSQFTNDGEFVRCIGVGTLTCPFDLDFSSCGDIVVADRSSHRICVFSPDDFTLLRAFGSEGVDPGQFQSPPALFIHSDQLYVLDTKTSRVQVFN